MELACISLESATEVMFFDCHQDAVKRKPVLVLSYQLHNYYIQVFPISFDDLHIWMCTQAGCSYLNGNGKT